MIKAVSFGGMLLVCYLIASPMECTIVRHLNNTDLDISSYACERDLFKSYMLTL